MQRKWFYFGFRMVLFRIYLNAEVGMSIAECFLFRKYANEECRLQYAFYCGSRINVVEDCAVFDVGFNGARKFDCEMGKERKAE